MILSSAIGAVGLTSLLEDRLKPMVFSSLFLLDPSFSLPTTSTMAAAVDSRHLDDVVPPKVESPLYKMSFQEILHDLLSRFILNLPTNELSSMERIYFQCEQA